LQLQQITPTGQPSTTCERTSTAPAINKTYTNGFRAKTGVIESDNDELTVPRAQKFNRFLGQQIRIEINQHEVQKEELNTNHAETKNLLFYDFNAGARQFHFGLGTNARLATRGEFRRTGMAGAQHIDKNVIEVDDAAQSQAKRRPITSHFRGGDRLPSRASKTRERSKRIHIGARKKSKRQQQGKQEPPESMSPKPHQAYEASAKHMRQNVHTAAPAKQLAMFADLETESREPESSNNFRYRERMQRKKDIIIEEEDGEEDADKVSQNY